MQDYSCAFVCNRHLQCCARWKNMTKDIGLDLVTSFWQTGSNDHVLLNLLLIVKILLRVKLHVNESGLGYHTVAVKKGLLKRA